MNQKSTQNLNIQLSAEASADREITAYGGYEQIYKPYMISHSTAVKFGAVALLALAYASLFLIGLAA